MGGLSDGAQYATPCLSQRGPYTGDSRSGLAATELVLWDWYDQRGALYRDGRQYREVRPDVHIKVEIVPWEEF